MPAARNAVVPFKEVDKRTDEWKSGGYRPASLNNPCKRLGKPREE